MARQSLDIQRIVIDGTEPTYTGAITDGHMIEWKERMFVHIFNDDTASKTITIPVPQTISGLSVEDKTVSIPASTDMLIGPFLERQTYRQDDGTVYIDYSATTLVTIAALEI
jgi:hypothetical protein